VLEGTIRVGQANTPSSGELQTVDVEIKHTDNGQSDNTESEE
jgi:hypothetical protein